MGAQPQAPWGEKKPGSAIWPSVPGKLLCPHLGLKWPGGRGQPDGGRLGAQRVHCVPSVGGRTHAHSHIRAHAHPHTPQAPRSGLFDRLSVTLWMHSGLVEIPRHTLGNHTCTCTENMHTSTHAETTSTHAQICACRHTCMYRDQLPYTDTCVHTHSWTETTHMHGTG